MEEINKIVEMLEKNAYKKVDSFPGIGEVSLRLGPNMNCPILECQTSDQEELKSLLKEMKYKMMIREKGDGIVQFILKK